MLRLIQLIFELIQPCVSFLEKKKHCVYILKFTKTNHFYYVSNVFNEGKIELKSLFVCTDLVNKAQSDMTSKCCNSQAISHEAFTSDYSYIKGTIYCSLFSKNVQQCILLNLQAVE